MNKIPEKVLVGSIQKFSVEDGPGIRTTVFLKGCPLSCKWCHNPELIDPKQQLIQSPNNCIGCGYCIKTCPKEALSMTEDGIEIHRETCDVCLACAEQCFAKALRPVGKWMTTEEVLAVAAQDKGFYDNTGGGITISGGEMLTQAAFVKELVELACERDIRVCLDTSGYGDSKVLMALAKHPNVTDILLDIKSIDDAVHRKYTGVSNCLILKNLAMLAAEEETRNKVTVRMPLVHGVNDHRELLEKTGDLLSKLGIGHVDLLPYHDLGISKQRNIGGVQEVFEAPSEEMLGKTVDDFRNRGIPEVGILGKV